MGDAQRKDQFKRSRQIDAQLREDYKKRQNEEKLFKKVVLLGSSDCGKTTILKQLKILYGAGFTPEELRLFKRSANDNVFDSICALMNGMREIGLQTEDPQTLEAMSLFDQETRDRGEPITPEMADAALTIWNDSEVKKAFARRNEFLIQDTAEFFITNAKRLTEANFTPSQEDVLMIRILTTSISVTRLQFGQVGCDFIDVGGHRSFRFRWAPYLTGSLACIFFVMSLACYDQKLAEDSTVSRMDDAIQLFQAVCKNELLKQVMMIVFLNKVDLFEEKVKKNPIKKYYTDFKSDNPDPVKAGISYFRKKFDLPEGERPLYHHVTKATDTQLMKTILLSVTNALTQLIIKNSGLA